MSSGDYQSANVAINYEYMNCRYSASKTTNSGAQSDPWWHVSLPLPVEMRSIWIWNDRENMANLYPMNVTIFDSNNVSLISKSFDYVDQSVLVAWDFSPVMGSSINISLPGSARVLQIAEVQVFGGTVFFFWWSNLS